ncbi:hypothetical protein EV13_1865 [Prochlorococcus sp. MIT 0702]|nr:hypothetical protein EV13_1865 [Prochlorococcus sp. MIT 0702]
MLEIQFIPFAEVPNTRWKSIPQSFENQLLSSVTFYACLDNAIKKHLI